MIDFEALEQAFAPIEEIGRREMVVDVGGHTVHLRPLLPREEVEIQRFARAYVDEHADEDGRVPKHVEMGYYDRYRTEILAYAIAQVDGLDLRGVDYIPTGQKTSKGAAVRVPKHVAIRELITVKRPWSRVMLEIAFNKFSELLGQIEQDSRDLVEYEPSDLISEIGRVEKRLNELRGELTNRAKGDPNLMTKEVEALLNLDKAEQKARQTAGRIADAVQNAGPQVGEPEPTPEPEPEPEPAPLEDTEVPEDGPDEEEASEDWADFEEMPSVRELRDEPPPPQDPVPSRRTVPREPVLPRTSPPPGQAMRPPAPPVAPPTPPPEPVDPLEGVMDSFQDPEDPSVVASEEARILAARKKLAAEREAERAIQAQPVVRKRVPPHKRGVREEAVSLDAVPAGKVGEAPAFRLPTQELSHRGRGRSGGRPETDQVADAQTPNNPNFKPPSR